MATLLAYVKSNSTAFLATSKSDPAFKQLVKQLDPATLQVVKLALSQAYDKL